MGRYEEALAQLNKPQREAVETIDGPLLVVAGPGTGKTQLLSMRVAYILKQTDTNPSNILCVTFTNKAATNMRDRLHELTDGASRGVVVKTFHGFAAEIINQYPEYFWNNARLELAQDSLQLEIVESILSSLALDNPLALTFAGQYTLTSDVQEALKLVKEAGLTPAKLEAIIRANLAYLDVIEPELIMALEKPLRINKLGELQAQIERIPEQGVDEYIAPLISLSTALKESLAFAISQDELIGKTKHTSAWKQQWVQTIDGKKGVHKEHKRNEWWLAIADVYEQYRSTLHQRGYYDYADMVVEVISQLEQHADLRADIQERFLYVLIDEFQDTNAAQLRLAQLVSDHHTAQGRPNIMVVGDDDQSIYKFNGAELNNMLSFRRTYPTSRFVVLQDNYRSTQDILDVSSAIISQAEDRLVKREPSITKALISHANKQRGDIRQTSYPTREHQYSAVVDDISSRYSLGQTDIAILARSHKSLRSIAALLAEANVPVRYEQQRNILEHQVIQQILHLAQIIAGLSEGNTEQVNHYLSRSLRHPMWNIKPMVLWEIARENSQRPDWIGSLANHPDLHLNKIADWLMWLSTEASYQPVPVIFEQMLGLRKHKTFHSPLQKYLKHSQNISSEYVQTLSATRLLLDLVSDFASGTQAKLPDFIRFVTLNQSFDRVIADETAFVSGQAAVELLTVHKAKGLEFDTVYIVDAVESQWQPSNRSRRPPANLPLRPNLEDFDDYARLMYVAATRARHTLLVSSYLHDSVGNDVLPSPLIRDSILEQLAASPDTEETVRALERSLRWPRLTSNNEQAILGQYLSTFQLSATGLLDFLDVSRGGPQHFLERHLLRLPEVTTPALAHGTAMHAALELAQQQINSATFDLSEVQEHYVSILQRQHLPVDEEQRYSIHGTGVIERLFHDLNYELRKGSLPEQLIRDVALAKARLNGRLDRIDVDNDHLSIVDYKTGKPLTSFFTKDKNKAVKAWRHRTQLLFYVLLTQQSGRFPRAKVFEGSMVYVEADSAKDLVRTYAPSSEDLERLQKLILVVWQCIQSLSFPSIEQYSPNYTGIVAFENDLLAGNS